jgi:phosphatidylglycerol:prolipoprotein diacylglycerol transferase
MPAVITFTFDPVLRISETSTVRLETIALAIVLFACLLLTARIGSVTPAIGRSGPGLRVDDLAFMVVGAVPGAVLGGRLGYVVDHLEFYRANPSAIIDPGQGALSLTLAVPFALVTGGLIARLLNAPVGRWMHVLVFPVLILLGAGKLVGVFGGSGQGAPSTLEWATAYIGPGPWGSLAADVPSHPSQAYEAVAVGFVVLMALVISPLRLVKRRNGILLFIALALWAAARFAVAFTWRDPATLGSISVEQALLAAVFLVMVLGVVERAAAARRVPIEAPVEVAPEPA